MLGGRPLARRPVPCYTWPMRPPFPLIALLSFAVLPASGGDLPKPADFLKSASEAPAAEVKGAPASRPFVMVRLRMSPFKGKTVAETRANAERFLASDSAGRVMRHYQDNEAARAVEVRAKEASGAISSISRALRLRAARKSLENSPLVDHVTETAAGLTAVFKDPLYDEEIAVLARGLPDGLSWDRYRNASMSGIWVDFEAKDAADAKEFAARIAARHPAEVEGAEALHAVETFRGAF